MITAAAAVACLAAFCDEREDRLRDLTNICAFIPSDNLDAAVPEPTPDEIIVKYHVTTNTVIEDLKEIVRRSDITETDFYAKVPRQSAVSFIGQYGGTNDLPYLHTIMTNSSDYAQHAAIGACISILHESSMLMDLAREIVTNSSVYSGGLRGWTYSILIGMCSQGESDSYIDNPAQHARIAAFFLERAAVEEDDILFIDRCACRLNPWYRHSQQRRDNLAALRPPDLTGRPAELYDAAQADAAQDD